MERFSLKKMEEILFKENVKFERVHKSFLINPTRLIAISGKAQAYKLELEGLDSLIPVSRSYSINLLEQKLIEKN
ncbi:MAG: LytTR family transcriptional regulator [Crocinitomicaceae bacterium]|nr:MAG: LytTR family transcriptional regulator [Crocinitomicaceae bacterium]